MFDDGIQEDLRAAEFSFGLLSLCNVVNNRQTGAAALVGHSPRVDRNIDLGSIGLDMLADVLDELIVREAANKSFETLAIVRRPQIDD